MAQQKVDISVPTSLDNLGRRVVGQEIVDFIVSRTQRGLDINGNPFPGYSEAYKNSPEFEIAGKTNTVNLTLTGDMLSGLQVLSHSTGRITVGYLNGSEENERAEWHRAPRPNIRTGSLAPTRNFLGITQADLDIIVNRYLRSNPVIEEVQSQAQREARAIFNRVLSRFGGNDNG